MADKAQLLIPYLKVMGTEMNESKQLVPSHMVGWWEGCRLAAGHGLWSQANLEWNNISLPYTRYKILGLNSWSATYKLYVLDPLLNLSEP